MLFIFLCEQHWLPKHIVLQLFLVVRQPMGDFIDYFVWVARFNTNHGLQLLLVIWSSTKSYTKIGWIPNSRWSFHRICFWSSVGKAAALTIVMTASALAKVNGTSQWSSSNPWKLRLQHRTEAQHIHGFSLERGVLQRCTRKELLSSLLSAVRKE